MTEPVLPKMTEQDDERDTVAFPKFQSTSNVPPNEQSAPLKKRKNHRAGRKTKGRRRSFAVVDEAGEHDNATNPNLDSQQHSLATRPPFYSFGHSGGRALSESSMDSEALLDHRYALQADRDINC